MDLQVFNQNGWEIRTIEKDNEPWFVAKDVCGCLEIKDTSSAMLSLPDYEKLIQTIMVSGQNRDIWTINESGLYSLIFKSRKAEAKKFQKWVTFEVLPQIRKTGSYSKLPQTLPEALRFAADEAEAREIAEKKLIEQKPMVEFAKAIEGTQELISVGDFAKVSGKIGRNTLFKKMRESKIVQKSNLPFQRYIDQGYFEVKESITKRTNGDMLLKTTYITGKGQLWMDKKLNEWA